MKNFKRCIKGMVLAISIFVLFAFSDNSTIAQVITTAPTCFTLSIALVAGSACNTDVCAGGTNSGNNCDICFTVTIGGKCAELPQSFQITSDECFSICSPSGDFTLGTHSGGVCDNAAKQIVWKNASGGCAIPPCNPPVPPNPPCVGMSNTDQGTFRICGSGAHQVFHIALVSHCMSLCSTPCTDAVITLP